MDRANSWDKKNNQKAQDQYQIVIKDGDINEQINSLEQQITEHFRQEHFSLVVDLREVKVAPARMLAYLISSASQARRLGGDIELKNLQPFVRNNLMTFSPKTFLSIEPSEDYALYDFGEDIELEPLPDKSKNKSVPPDSEEPKTEEVVENNHNDEIALEILQSLSLTESDKVRINSSADSLYKVCDFVVQCAEKAGFDKHELAKLKVTTYEASLNVVEHAYFSNPDYWIDVYAVTRDSKFYIVIHDWGVGFEFNPDRDYDVEAAVKNRKTGGFGLHIIRRSVDEIYYLKDQKVGNRLILVKNLPDRK